MRISWPRCAGDAESARLRGRFTHPTEHQVGFRYHDKGLRLEPGSIALLEEGLVVTVEPGAYGSAFGGGARFEDNVYVDEVGAEVLSA